MIMNTEQEKIDVRIGDIAIEIPPEAVQTILSMKNSMGQLQVMKMCYC